ncbi:hypothetical protein ALC56_04777 [Trachymyrmex septentrionalis]|uniref:Uncharacterized protein n=1 Tax=Trachymyrmex septentrionalis TaxID=34720 RepID=A0A195FKK8_9HYME|nr:hypothetical protein ALC56_04777 [Trachymyrmex septentrionalis]
MNPHISQRQISRKLNVFPATIQEALIHLTAVKYLSYLDLEMPQKRHIVRAYIAFMKRSKRMNNLPYIKSLMKIANQKYN